MKIGKSICLSLCCILLAALIALAAFGVRLEITTAEAIKEVPAEIADRLDVIAYRADQRIGQVVDSANHLIARTDARTGQVLGIVDKMAMDVPALIDRHAANAETILDSQLTMLNATVSQNAAPIGRLADRYALLPDQIRADREYQGLMAETIGVLGATKITMGQVAKASKTFDDQWPVILDSGEKVARSSSAIAADIKREADDLTKPQTAWQQFRTWLFTFARLAGAFY